MQLDRTTPTLTPQEFVNRWRGTQLKERSASRSHFNDLHHADAPFENRSRLFGRVEFGRPWPGDGRPSIDRRQIACDMSTAVLHGASASQRRDRTEFSLPGHHWDVASP